MMLFLNLRKNSNQQELDTIFRLKAGNDIASHSVSKAAFSKARKNLSHTAFIELNRELVDDYYRLHKNVKKWCGFRLCAIDGSYFRLPNEPDIVEEFGLHQGKSSAKSCSMGISSMYYDVLNEITIDSCLSPSRSSERALASEHLRHADKDDLVLLDRNYPVFWLYAQMQSKGIQFCVRVRDNIDTLYKAFKESGKKECIVEITANTNSKRICKEKGLSTKPIKIRLVRVDLKDEVEILATSLLDKKTYPAAIFKKLYHFRWGIEEGYKRQKLWLEIENYSGKSALSVKQDYYGKIVTLNLTSIIARESQIIVQSKHKARRLKYKINFAQALSKMKDNVVLLLLNVNLKERIQQLIGYIANTIEAVRTNRHFVRKKRHHYNKNINHLCYKRCR